MIRLSLWLVLFLLSICSNAQQNFRSPKPGNARNIQEYTAPVCPSDDLLRQLLNANPAIRLRHNALDSLIYHQLDQRSSPLSRGGISSNQQNVVVSIPVVVHIIHNNGTENISDAVVAQGIVDLNQAFSNSGPYMQTNGVDIGVQFCLAIQDPNGLVTTGITRDVSPLTNMTMETDDILLKDLNRWDPLRYLNIWLVKEISSLSMGSGVAGYAYFPSSHGNPEDGIVNEAGFFGSSPDNSKVHIHECGHYLGLYHTFEGGCTNNDCLADGDHVCDTPPDNSTATVPCQSGGNTCTTDDDDLSVNNPFRPVSSGGIGDQQDQVENHMDYGFLGCHTLFTSGQKDRMTTALNGARASLLASRGCWSLCANPVTASFDTSNDTITLGTNLVFTNFSSGSSTYQWLINNLPVSSSVNLSYTFSSQGTFIIEMIAMNGDSSCTQLVYDTIHVVCGTGSSFSMSTSACIPRYTNVLFSNTTPGIVSCQWLKDGQVIGTDTTLGYMFPQTGGFQISLVTFNGTCYDTSATVFLQVGRCQDMEAAHWYFGNHAGLDFTSGTAVAVTNNAMWAFEGTVSMSDKAGNLLFYTDGDTMFNRNHVAMANSTQIYGGLSSCQSGLAVPWPDHPDKYIYFETAVAEDSFAAPFRYSVVDMSLDGGLGDIFPYNIVLHSPIEEKINGTMHCNGRSIWVMVHEWGTNNFLAYLVDSSGVNTTPVVNSIGPVHTGWFYEPGRGNIKFSNDGQWMAISTFDYPLELYRFDNATGLLSNPISFPASNYNLGVEFSPDNTKFYHFEHTNSGDGHINQYDLSSGNPVTIANSKTQVMLSAPGNQNALQIGPDGRIYFSNGFSPWDAYVGVIYNPNALGLACGASATGLHLNGKQSISGLPNFMSTSFFTDDLQIEGPDSVCPNATAQQYSIHANAWNLGNYTWSALGKLSVNSFSDSTISINFTGSGTDTLVISKTTNCGMLRDTLFIHAIPAYPDLGPDANLCAGDTLILSLPENYFSYAWQDGSMNPTFSAVQQGDYWVDVTTANSCILRDSIHINPNSSQTSVELGPDIIICPGAVVVLDAGAGYTSYRWQDGSGNPQFTAWQEGTYWVRVSSAGDCNSFAVDSIHVIYDNTLQISLGGDSTVCSGASLTLSPGAGFVSYVWSDQSTSATLTVNQNGTYWVQVVSAASCSASDTIDIVIDTVHANLGVDSALCQGGSLVLSPGNSFANYHWSDQSSQPTLTVTQAGDYWVDVVSLNNCVSSDSIHIDTKAIPSLQLGADTSLCPGEEILLQANAGFANYLWSTNETTSSITVNTAGFITLHATTSENCIAEDSIQVSYYFLSAIDLGTDTIICENENLRLHAGTNFYVYNWSNGSHDSTLLINAAGVYWVSASADFRCIASDSIEVFTKECKGPEYYIHVYPNPNDGYFYVEMLQGLSMHGIEIDIYDAIGKWIWHGEMDVEKDLISKKFILADIASGVYTVRIRGEGISESVKLMRY
ncbi:MAG: T9SS type A sorting domain-containing protein [Bacteroidetes bacterium]|nr:T9SS type A sorting domain-containing protein [Bacteroidota bacterium]MBP6649233.1 T9SS type A sorting domain-containing protein [Bacteroidia bacterium]